MDSYTTFDTQLASLRGDEICDPVFAIRQEKAKTENLEIHVVCGNYCTVV